MLVVTTTKPKGKLAYMELKERIKTARERAHFSKAKLASRVGVSSQAVLQWETGETKSIDGGNLVRAAYAMNVEPLWLATGEGPMHDDMMRDDPYIMPREFTQAWQHLDKKLREHLLAIAEALAEKKGSRG